MKKLLIVGAVLASLPFISFAQTSTTTVTQATGTVTITTTITNPGLIPGNFFYFLDRWSEAINMSFTFNKENKARKHFEYAKERVAEMKEVLKKPDAKLEDVADAKKNFDSQVSDAAKLLAGEKGIGNDVSELARELSDDLNTSRIELKGILQGYQDNQGRAESVMRAKLGSLTDGDAPQLKGLLEALNAITKEKDDATKEGDDLDADLSDEQEIFDEIMGKEMAEQNHMEQAMRLREHLEGIKGQIPAQASEFMKQAQEAIKKGDFDLAKRLYEIVLSVEDPIIGESDNYSRMMDDGAGDIGESNVNNLEQEIKKGEKMMEELER